MIETLNPNDKQAWLELRTKDITSTEISALFGISPYMTPFELWYRKKDGAVVAIEENERMKWGLALQDSIAKSIAEEQGWKIRRMDEYMRDTDARIGASFDFEVINPELGKINGLLEIKNVDGLVFKQEWTEDDKGAQAPLHIEIQVQHQLAVSGRSFCYIGALVGGNRLVLIKRTRDEAVIQAIKDKVAEFWASIEANTPPPANFEADAEFIGKLFGYAEPGKVLNVAQDADITKAAVEYKELGDQIKVAETRREAIKAELLTKCGDAEKIIGDGFTISASVQGPKWIEAYEKAGFRMFRVNWPRNGKKT